MTAVECHTRGEVRERWAPRPDGLEESVQFQPGYNCADDSMRGHGVHGMEIWWVLRGPAGMIFPYSRQLVLMGIDLGYCARAQRHHYEHYQELCIWIGAPCWSDGSGLRANALVPEFMARGESVIWAALEAEYAGLAG